MNRGAHYQDDATVLRDIEDTLTVLRRDRPDLLVIYRNTPAGHPGCGDNSTRFGPPLQHPANYSGHPMWQPDHLFHWSHFARQNELVRELLRTKFPHVLYIDVAGVTALRPDGHAHPEDCLHYCIPGPVDVWWEFIYHAMWALDRVADATRECCWP